MLRTLIAQTLAAIAVVLAGASSAEADQQLASSTPQLRTEFWQHGTRVPLTVDTDLRATVSLDREPFTIRLTHKTWAAWFVTQDHQPALMVAVSEHPRLFDLLPPGTPIAESPFYAASGYAEPDGGHDILFTVGDPSDGEFRGTNYVAEDRFNASTDTHLGRQVASVIDPERNVDLMATTDALHIVFYMPSQPQSYDTGALPSGDLDYVTVTFQ